MKPRISIAVVGLNFGRHVVRELTEGAAAELFQVLAVCDPNRRTADAIAQKIGVDAYHQLDGVLVDQSIAAGLFTGPLGRAG